MLQKKLASEYIAGLRLLKYQLQALDFGLEYKSQIFELLSCSVVDLHVFVSWAYGLYVVTLLESLSCGCTRVVLLIKGYKAVKDPVNFRYFHACSCPCNFSHHPGFHTCGLVCHNTFC